MTARSSSCFAAPRADNTSESLLLSLYCSATKWRICASVSDSSIRRLSVPKSNASRCSGAGAELQSRRPSNRSHTSQQTSSDLVYRGTVESFTAAQLGTYRPYLYASCKSKVKSPQWSGSITNIDKKNIVQFATPRTTGYDRIQKKQS